MGRGSIDRSALPGLVLAVLAAAWLAPATALAQAGPPADWGSVTTRIETDGTLGAADTISGVNSVYTVGEDLGSRAGNNLFHSFRFFDLGQGDTGRFTGSASIENVVSRITGGDPSYLNGTLESQIAGADFYFLNPSGVFFGPGASLDVPAAFYTSTAQSLGFDDGQDFATEGGAAPVLSMASPDSFGFFGTAPIGDIGVEGSTLAAAPSEALALVGGDIDLSGASVEASGGTLSLVGVGSAGEVGFDPAAAWQPMEVGSFATLGDVTLDNSAQLDASGDPAGAISIRARAIALQGGAAIRSNATGAQPNAPTAIDLAADTVRVEAGSAIESKLALGATGDGGRVAITASESIDVSGLHPVFFGLLPSKVSTTTAGHGDGGAITLRAPAITLADGAKVSADTEASGDGGQIELTARDSIRVSSASVNTVTEGEGQAGSIRLEAPTIGIADGGAVEANVETGAAGQGGSVAVTASESITVSGTHPVFGPLLPSKVSATTLGEGQGGSIALEAPAITVADGAMVSADTEASGGGGQIELTARDSILVSGAFITAGTTGGGNGGAIVLRAPTVTVDGGGAITALVQADATGHGGSIGIIADESILISGTDESVTWYSKIDSTTYGEGDGGAIALSAPKVTVDDGAGIFAVVWSDATGDGGTIDITADQSIAVSAVAKGGNFLSSSITSNTDGQGKGGAITLIAPTVTVDNGAAINAAVGGNATGDGGTIDINASESILVSGVEEELRSPGARSQMNSSTHGEGNGGAITLDAPTVTVDDGGAIAAVVFNGATGDGGEIGISASESILVSGESDDGYLSLIDSSSSGEGNSGPITLKAPKVTVDGGGRILAFSGKFATGGGTIDITASESILISGTNDAETFESGISSGTSGEGNGGAIKLDAPTVTIDGGAKIKAAVTERTATGDSGTIDITATESILISGSNDVDTLFSSVDGGTAGAGNGGAVTLRAPTVTVEGGGSIRALALLGSTGAGGTIDIAADQSIAVSGNSDRYAPWLISGTYGAGAGGAITLKAPQVTVEGGGVITALAGAAATGEGGTIDITASESILVSGGKEPGTQRSSSTIDSSTFGMGKGGAMTLRAPTITVAEGGRIQAAVGTGATGDGGSIGISASESILVSGTNESGNYASVINSGTAGEGKGGAITLTAPNVTAEGGGIIAASVFTDATGDGGTIDISASESILISGTNERGTFGSSIESNTAGEGNGGAMTLRAPFVEVDKGGSIEAEVRTRATGDGGSIDITAERLLSLRSNTPLGIERSRISASTEGEGNGGSITLKAGAVDVSGDARIFADVGFGAKGDGGIIDITADEDIFIYASFVDSGTQGEGASGAISLRAPTITVERATISASAVDGKGDGGSIGITADESILIDSSEIFSRTYGEGAGGSIDITANESISIDSSEINSSTEGEGNGGAITLTAPNVNVEGGGGIFAEVGPDATGEGGSIDITADESILIDSSEINSSTSGEGDGGSISLAAPAITLQDRAQVSAEAEEGAAGDGGAITLTADTSVWVTDKAEINASTAGDSRAGTIAIEAHGVTVDEGGAITASTTGAGGDIAITAEGGVGVHGGGSTINIDSFEDGEGGSITITTPGLAVAYGGTILARNFGTQPGGDIVITASEFVEVLDSDSTISAAASGEGPGGSIRIQAPAEEPSALFVNVAYGAAIEASTEGAGDGGSITIDADRLQVSDAATIAVDTSRGGAGGSIDIDAGTVLVYEGGDLQATVGEFATGAGGDINVTADGLWVTGLGSTINAETSGDGDGGNIAIEAPIVVVEDAAFISARASGDGDGGNIDVTADEALWVTGLGSTINAATAGDGDGGSIRIQAPAEEQSALEVYVTDGGFISARTTGNGDAGDIQISASESVLVTGFSFVDADSSGAGDGGSIAIEAPLVVAENGASISAAAFASGDGGAITIRNGESKGPDDVIRVNGATVSTTTYGAGSGGDITFDALAVEILGGGEISAAVKPGAAGDGGSVTITADESILISGTDASGTYSSAIDSSTYGEGNGGAITLEAPKVTVEGGGAIVAAVESGATGGGGTIDIVAANAIVVDGGTIRSDTRGPGAAGAVSLVADQLTIKGGSSVSSNTSGYAFFPIDFDPDNPSSGFFSTTETNDPLLSGEVKFLLITSRTDDPWFSDLEIITIPGLSASTIYIAAFDNQVGSGTPDLVASSYDLETGLELAFGDDGSPLGNGLAPQLAGRSDRNGEIALLVSGYPDEEFSGNHGELGDYAISIATNPLLGGNGGSIQITAGDLLISESSEIRADTSGIGNGGTITIGASESVSIQGASLISTSTTQEGQGGAITVGAPEVTVDAGAGIFATVGRDATGDGGSVTITAGTSIAVRGTDESGNLRSLIDSSTFGAGKGGAITLRAPTVSVTGGGVIGAAVNFFATGAGGTVDITADESILVSGMDALGLYSSSIDSSTLGEGKGGAITLTTPNVTVKGGGAIRAIVGPGATGDGGSVTITADESILISGTDASGTSSSIITTESSGTGDGGSITLRAPTVRVEDRAELVASGLSTGAAGDIRVNASNLLRVDGASINANSDFSVTEIPILVDYENETGFAFFDRQHLLDVVAEDLRALGYTLPAEPSEAEVLATYKSYLDRLGIGDSFSGTLEEIQGTNYPGTLLLPGGEASIERILGEVGGAGSIDLEVGQLELANGGNIQSGATDGPGGTVRINATRSVSLTGRSTTPLILETNQETVEVFQSFIQAGSDGVGQAGSVTINTPQLLLDDQAVITTEARDVGDAGDIALSIDQLTLRGGSEIRSESAATTASLEEFYGSSVFGKPLDFRPELDALLSAPGAAGKISVEANAVRLSGASQISVAESVGAAIPEGLGSGAPSRGLANGDIAIAVRDWLLLEGGSLIAASVAEGLGGSIAIGGQGGQPTQGLILRGGSAILAQGGPDIDTRLVVPTGVGYDTVRVPDNDVIGTDPGSTPQDPDTPLDPGNEVPELPDDPILITPAPLLAEASAANALTRAATSSGSAAAAALTTRGGDIAISANVVLLCPTCLINADGPTSGSGGSVVINNPETAIESQVVPPEISYLDASSQLLAECGVGEGDSEEGGRFEVARWQTQPLSSQDTLLALAPYATGPSAATQLARTTPEPSSEEGDETADILLAQRGGAEEEEKEEKPALPESLAPQAAALETARASGDPAREAEALADLANGYAALGEWDAARPLLDQAVTLTRGEKLPDAEPDTAAPAAPVLRAGLLNNRGHVEAMAGDPEAALASYRASAEAARASGEELLAAQAEANAARSALALGESAEATAALERSRGALGQAKEVTPAQQTALRIHLAQSETALARQDPAARSRALRAAHADLRRAAESAEASGDPRAAAEALGQLGALYGEEPGREREARYLTRRAIGLAEEEQAADLLARFYAQLGQLEWQSGQPEASLDATRRAVALFEETRPEANVSEGRADTAFRQSVEPVYLALVDRLLLTSAEAPSPTAQQEQLDEARRVVEQWKAAELRNYFRDSCAAQLVASAQSVESLDPHAAVIYPIVLPDRLELLVSRASGTARVTVPVSQAELTREVNRFRHLLAKRVTHEYQAPAQKLHRWLVDPYLQLLMSGEIDTLVFVPSGVLRTIPMAALHDGNRFLVERYAVAVTPSLDLLAPKPLDPEQTDLLLVGVSESVQGYPGLPGVKREIDAVEALYGGQVLLDDDFDQAGFESAVRNNRPGIVHLASHAEFTGDPDSSYVLTHDDRVSMEELSALVRSGRYSDEPVELLLLSACETAVGDERAALGLAGVAIRAGARSAMGSLWSVSDAAASELVVGFYEQLGTEDTSKAQALQRAQKSLLNTPRFQHPYYWAPFLVMNNWL